MPRVRHSVASSSTSSASSSSSAFTLGLPRANERSTDKWHTLSRSQKRAFKIARETSPLDLDVSTDILKDVFNFSRLDRSDEYPPFITETMRFWIAYAIENGNTRPIISFIQTATNPTHSLKTILHGHPIRAFALIAFFIQLHGVDHSLSDLFYNCDFMDAIDLEDQTIPSMLVDHFAQALLEIKALESACTHSAGTSLGLAVRAKKAKRRLLDPEITCNQAYGLDLIHEFHVRVWNPPGYSNGKALLKRARLEVRPDIYNSFSPQSIDLSEIQAIRRIQLSVYLKTQRNIVQLYFSSTDEVLAFQCQLVAWCSSTDEFFKKIEKSAEEVAELEALPSPFPTQVNIPPDDIPSDPVMHTPDLNVAVEQASPTDTKSSAGTIIGLMCQLLSPKSFPVSVGVPSCKISPTASTLLNRSHLT